MDNNLQSAFRKVYNENLWGSQESCSGPGSTLDYTEDLRKILPVFLHMLECKTLLDAPCGDFHWMKETELGEISYIGADIVPELVGNNRRHSNKKRDFRLLDITTDVLPEADIWLCRDVLIHLPNMSIMQLLRQFMRSKIKYLMTTHYPWVGDNGELYSIVIGRDVNLTRKPFLLPEPLYAIKDFVPPAPARLLAIWSREQIITEFKKQQECLAFLFEEPG